VILDTYRSRSLSFSLIIFPHVSRFQILPVSTSWLISYMRPTYDKLFENLALVYISLSVILCLPDTFYFLLSDADCSSKSVKGCITFTPTIDMTVLDVSGCKVTTFSQKNFINFVPCNPTQRDLLSFGRRSDIHTPIRPGISFFCFQPSLIL
jgi:hypothetical protein